MTKHVAALTCLYPLTINGRPPRRVRKIDPAPVQNGFAQDTGLVKKIIRGKQREAAAAKIAISVFDDLDRRYHRIDAPCHVVARKG